MEAGDDVVPADGPRISGRLGAVVALAVIAVIVVGAVGAALWVVRGDDGNDRPATLLVDAGAQSGTAQGSIHLSDGDWVICTGVPPDWGSGTVRGTLSRLTPPSSSIGASGEEILRDGSARFVARGVVLEAKELARGDVPETLPCGAP